MAEDRDFKIVFAIVLVAVFIAPSIFPSAKNSSVNEVFAQDSNSSVIVENRAMSPESLLCDNGMQPDVNGICADGSHPLVTRANPIPTIDEPANETNQATTIIVSLCADHTIATATTDNCHDGSIPLQIDIEDLTCTNGNDPVPNGTCADGSLPQLLNKTKTDGSEISN